MTAARSSGRPRDPEIDSAILEGARATFMSSGWLGFGFEGVARAAKVGKPAVYRRWQDKSSLIVEALRAAQPPVATDTGSFFGDIAQLARGHVEWWLTDSGPLLQRILAERFAHADFAKLLDEAYLDRSRALREVTIRALDRREVRKGTSPSMVAELLIGAISTHFNYLREDRRTVEYLDEHHQYADKLARTVATAVLVEPSTMPKRRPAKRRPVAERPTKSARAASTK